MFNIKNNLIIKLKYNLIINKNEKNWLNIKNIKNQKRIKWIIKIRNLIIK